MATVWTDAGLEYMAQAFTDSSGLGGPPEAVEFRIGEGGWETVAAVQVPKVPDPTRTTLDCQGPDALIWAGLQSDFYFSVALTPGVDVTRVGKVITAVARVELADANDDGHGNDPEFWEAGLFLADGTMLAYSTFPRQIKNNTRILRHTFTLTLQRA